MKTSLLIIIACAFLQLNTTGAQTRRQPPSQQDVETAEKASKAADELMEQGKSSEALVRYKEALSVLPTDPTLLFNAGLAAYLTKDYAAAADWWKQLKISEPEDWHVRAKLIQAYQAMGRLAERDTERSDLFQLRKSSNVEDLSQQPHYCRDQFEVNKLRVMVFEHFELMGDRALRYVFSVLNEAGNDEEFRISLGSYDVTNAVWRETAKPKPKDGERLFHLDGYFKGLHVTYGMFAPEPSYDDVRSRVIKILEERKSKPQ